MMPDPAAREGKGLITALLGVSAWSAERLNVVIGSAKPELGIGSFGPSQAGINTA